MLQRHLAAHETGLRWLQPKALQAGEAQGHGMRSLVGLVPSRYGSITTLLTLILPCQGWGHNIDRAGIARLPVKRDVQENLMPLAIGDVRVPPVRFAPNFSSISMVR